MNIILEGVKQNNLKNLTVEIPKKKMTVVTGISGSGKTSLVFDVIYAEAQRQLLESVGTFSRISIPKYDRPHVNNIQGLAPTFIIDQRQISSNPRSTVGTYYEIYSYLRLLYSRFGFPRVNAGDLSFNNPSGACENCNGTGKEIKVNVNKLLNKALSLNEGAICHRSYKVGGREWNILNAIGLFDMNKKLALYSNDELNTLLYSETIKCSNNAMGFVQNFTFEGLANRIIRRATDARGLEGVKYDSIFTYEDTCHVCNGSRLNKTAREVLYHGESIVNLVTMEVSDLYNYFYDILSSEHEKESDAILEYIVRMLKVLVDLGLGYVSLSRPIGSLSNGEAQRIKLARQLGTSLTDIIYVLDEPTSGLHAKDIDTIISTLKKLVDNSNTVIVVEHDRDMIKNADHILELGPYAGKNGGHIVFQGSYDELLSKETITSQYIKLNTAFKEKYNVPVSFKRIIANRNNLHDLEVDIPLKIMTCITGVSGSGKSSLIQEIARSIDNCIIIDQSKIGTSVRSNAVTYTDAFTDIRKEFSKANSKPESLFAFNSKGACDKCNGLGYININMHFLGDVRTTCEKCGGRRYTNEILNYLYKNKSIADVLDMTVDEALQFFDNKNITNKLDVLSKVGLGYLTLGQSFDTISGGEAQRIRLASGLSKQGNVFILDEPSKGLHLYDVNNLIKILSELVARGNTVIIVEHNLDIIRQADYIIDLGPGAGKLGGKIVAQGPPNEIKKSSVSITAKYL